MVILVNFKDNYNTAITTASKSLDFDLSATQSCVIFQDAEYIKVAGAAWEEAVEIAKSEDGWREEKSDKKMVNYYLTNSLPYFTLYCKAEINPLSPGRHLQK